MGLACLSCLSGFALIAMSVRAGILFGPSPLLDVLAICEIAASAGTVGALSFAFARALHAPPDVRRDAVLRCWQGTAITAAIALLPGVTLVV
ncbi:MAG TPA: hypothetical protein VLC47_06945 [Burkholderiales bacterium]|nr:hypothetical protein [Burkholderiales bacterium]